MFTAPFLSLRKAYFVGLVLLLCSAAPAVAGSWHITVGGSGSGSITAMGHTSAIGNWSAPTGTFTNSVTLSAYGTGISTGGAGNSCTSQISVNPQFTFTWVADPNLPSDPAPPSVVLIESATAHATITNPDGSQSAGSVNDGPATPDTPNASGVATTPTSIPVAHWFRKSGSSFTVTRTISASGTATASAPYTDGSGNFHNGVASVGTQMDSYTVSIHAQPYNFNITNITTSTTPVVVIHDTVNWSSTSGALGDLSYSIVYEYLTYPGGNPFQYPAPFIARPPNPATYPDTANAQGTDGHIVDNHIQPQWNPPIVKVPMFYVTQYWYFSDAATGEKDVQIPTTSGPYQIGTALSPLGDNPSTTDASNWWYTKTFSGPGVGTISASGNLWDPSK